MVDILRDTDDDDEHDPSLDESDESDPEDSPVEDLSHFHSRINSQVFLFRICLAPAYFRLLECKDTLKSSLQQR